MTPAYANAFKAARERAEAYGEAAGLKIVRVVNIIDGRESGAPDAGRFVVQPVAPPPVVQTAMPPQEEAAPFNPGVNRTEVRVRVDFALGPA